MSVILPRAMSAGGQRLGKPLSEQARDMGLLEAAASMDLDPELERAAEAALALGGFRSAMLVCGVPEDEYDRAEQAYMARLVMLIEEASRRIRSEITWTTSSNNLPPIG